MYWGCIEIFYYYEMKQGILLRNTGFRFFWMRLRLEFRTILIKMIQLVISIWFQNLGLDKYLNLNSVRF